MLYTGLTKITDNENVLKNEPLSKHCTFRIGGTCDYVVTPKSSQELIEILKLLKEENIPFSVIGNGSNILFSDEHHNGVIIKTTKLNSITVSENEITAEAGAKLIQVCNIAMENELSGMERISGIPGTLGGAVYMNAGAYDGEIADVCIKTFYLDENFNICEIEGNEHEFSYRHSFFTDKNYIILKSVLQLKKGNKTEIKEKMAELIEKRNSKQPLNFPNAGSTFKRPEGYFAGKLIEDCGLKGYHIGDAYVSEKHSGFIVNKNAATAKDVCELISYVQKKVKEEFQVNLEPEIKFI